MLRFAITSLVFATFAACFYRALVIPCVAADRALAEIFTSGVAPTR